MTDYTINIDQHTITLHKPMTIDELCCQLLRDGHGDMVEAVKWRPDEKTFQMLRDGGIVHN